MKMPGVVKRGLQALAAVRLGRLALVLLAAAAAGVLSDAWREERVLFPKNAPVEFTIVPAAP